MSYILKCKECGGELKRYDAVSRIVRTKGGQVQTVSVERYRCRSCRKIRRELPDYLFPHKHYEADIIQGVVDGTITSETLGFEDYPCEMTMKRWSRK